MTRKWHVLASVASLSVAAACSNDSTDALSPSDISSAALGAALSTVPVGYGDVASSYVGTAAASVGASGGLWLGGGREARFGADLMGGGLADAFAGGITFGGGRGGHRGPFGGVFGGSLLGCTGTFNATSGRVECAAETRNGLTVTRSAAYANAAGQVQQAFDTLTTNRVNTRVSVTGTVAYDRSADSASGRGGRGGHGRGPHLHGPGGRLLGDTATILTATTTVNSTSERTVTGLAAGSTQRTVSGASRGTESTTGTSSRGAFTATRTVGDTTTGVVIAVRTAADSGRPYPTAGTVIRAMQATLTYAGQTPTTVSRREVVTYNGTATANVVITENGTTRTCTRPLTGRGGLTCQ
jgi:hypothetical protein